MTDQNLISPPFCSFHVLVGLGRYRDYLTKNFDPRAQIFVLLHKPTEFKALLLPSPS